MTQIFAPSLWLAFSWKCLLESTGVSFWWSLIYLFFPFIANAFLSQKSLPNPKLKKFSPIISSRNFIVLGFIFMIHFKIILCVEWGRGWVSFFFHVIIQLFQHQLFKTLAFSHWVMLVPMSLKINWPYVHWPTFGLFSRFNWFMCFPLYQYHFILITLAL